MTGALATDLYELNMAASYLRRGMVRPATFSLFVRSLPPSRGFLVATGLEDCLTFLERFRFDEDELAWLGEALGFDQSALDAFRRLRFTGEVSADAPYLDSAYKLVAYGDRPVLKLSPEKATAPGRKQVFRAPDAHRELVGLRSERPSRAMSRCWCR